MTAVSTILTDVAYDLKLTSAQQTSRQAELISYMNRIIRNGIMPTFVRFESDYGMKDWITTETTAYLQAYSLPSDFVSFYALYCIEKTHSGTLASAASATSVTLDSDASDSDDDYNGEFLRLTSGTYADQQAQILDYDGDTVTASLGTGLSGTPSTDTFMIFECPSDDNELGQLSVGDLLKDYSSTGDPEKYALDRNTNILLGNIPDDANHVLWGKYFYLPTLLDATDDTLPYDEIFDEIIRQYVSIIGMNRDEYDVKFEAAVYTAIQNDVISIMRTRNGRSPSVVQSKIYGSND